MITCPYCNNEAKVSSGKEIYPGRYDLYDKKFYLCKPCDARVGCHKDGRPLGPLANLTLRRMRSQAHAAFDPIWKDGDVSRKKAYEDMSAYFKKEMHIGESDEYTCAQIIKYSVIKRKENGTDQ